MTSALGVTVAQATLAPVVLSTEAIRTAVAEGAVGVCPDGWAAEHAAALGLSEAEVMGWYLRDSLTLSDAVVIATVGMVLTEVEPDASRSAEVAARHQILLCIAESRRMTQPAETLIPPELRDA